MKAREYNILSMAVEQGINAGWRRARKHNETPSEDDIRDAIHDAVMSEICEWFIFDITFEELE